MATATKRKPRAKPKKKTTKQQHPAPQPPDPSKFGRIGWLDLTVPDAQKLRDFYSRVVGWQSTGVEMGGYSDFLMSPPGKDAVAGICHARGTNVGLPNVWLPYFTVGDVDAAVRNVEALGGALRGPVRSMGAGARFCIIEDPAGAVCALFQPPAETVE